MRTITWTDDAIEMIDQTRLPDVLVTLRIDTIDELVGAIQRLSIRGAPAIGVAGAYGVALAARLFDPGTAPDEFDAAVGRLRAARPTAVNLATMVDRVADVARVDPSAALEEAHLIAQEETRASIAMGDRGADLVQEFVGGLPARVMTICNTGGLATVERGTALAVVQTLHERGLLAEALPVETRPLLQGSRLTTWELQRMGAPHRLIVDSAGPSLLARGMADVVLIGADRIAANGDTANKIGSLSLALGAAHAGVPFIVVAPESTVDRATRSGDRIEIEDRGPDEVVTLRGVPIAPPATNAINPAFDVTPADLITAIVTERRTIRFDLGHAPPAA